MSQIKMLKLPPLPQCNPTALTQLAQNIDSFSLILPPHIFRGKTPLPRHINEILADIEGNRTITLLEWVYCLQTKKQWDRQHPNDSLPTAEAIWQSAKHDGMLKCLLEWRLKLYDRGFKDAIASSLVKVAAIELEERGELKE